MDGNINSSWAHITHTANDQHSSSIWAGEQEGQKVKNERKGKKQTQGVTTSPIWRHGPSERTKTKFSTRDHVADVIICFKSYRNQLRGFRAVRGQNWGFPMDLWQSPLQQVSTTVLPVINHSTMTITTPQSLWSVVPPQSLWSVVRSQWLRHLLHRGVITICLQILLIDARQLCGSLSAFTNSWFDKAQLRRFDKHGKVTRKSGRDLAEAAYDNEDQRYPQTYRMYPDAVHPIYFLSDCEDSQAYHLKWRKLWLMHLCRSADVSS